MEVVTVQDRTGQDTNKRRESRSKRKRILTQILNKKRVEFEFMFIIDYVSGLGKLFSIYPFHYTLHSFTWSSKNSRKG